MNLHVRYKKAIAILLAVAIVVTGMNFIFPTENGHFVEFGQEANAAPNEWTLVQEASTYIHYKETTASFLITGTTAKFRFNCPITGGPDKWVFMEFNDLPPSLYEYYFEITNSYDYNYETVFWSYNVDFNSYGAGCPEFRSGSADASWNKYYFRFYRKLKNNVPTITTTIPGNTILTEKDTEYIPQISVSDPNNDTLTCKYFIDSETTPRDTRAVTNTTAAQTVSFNSLNIGTLAEGTHTFKFEVSDGKVTHTCFSDSKF